MVDMSLQAAVERLLLAHPSWSWTAAAGTWSAADWRGAEGTSPVTLERLLAASAEAGLRMTRFHPCMPDYYVDVPPFLLFSITCAILCCLLLIIVASDMLEMDDK